MLSIEHAATSADIDVARELFWEYGRSLGVDLGFQGFDAEVAGLPGAYAPPRGRLLIARDDGRAVGCVALRPLADDVCEMKRLYLRPGLRGRGVGRMLAERIIDEARSIGYRVMRLDTLPSMTDAFALYERLGFVPIAPYYPNPVPGTRYMERAL